MTQVEFQSNLTGNIDLIQPLAPPPKFQWFPYPIGNKIQTSWPFLITTIWPFVSIPNQSTHPSVVYPQFPEFILPCLAFAHGALLPGASFPTPSTGPIKQKICDNLKNILFSLAYYIVRVQDLIHICTKKCVNWLFMLLVRLPVNSRVLVVKVWGNQKLYSYFQLYRGQSP